MIQSLCLPKRDCSLNSLGNRKLWIRSFVLLRDEYFESLEETEVTELDLSIDTEFYNKDISLLAKKYPKVDDITIGLGFDLENLSELSVFSSLISLNISIPIENVSKVLSVISTFPKLQKLFFDELCIEKEDHFFAKIAEFKNLTELGIYDCTLMEDYDLLGITKLSQLTSLSLENGSLITDQGIKYLNKLNNLEKLEFRKLVNVKGESLDSFISLSKLRVLTFSDMGISDHSLSHLKNWNGRELFLFDCNSITDKGIESLYLLKELEFFHFSSKNIKNKKLSHLLNFPKLKALDVSYTDLSTEELLLIEEKLPLLESLSVRCCELETQEGLETLLIKLPHLKTLDISYCSTFRDSSFRNFSKLSLEKLGMTGLKEITEKALEEVLKIKTLQILFLDHCPKISKEFIENLKKEHPRLIP